MMLEHMAWKEAASRIRCALQATVQAGTVTYDLARQIPGATEVSCSGFAQAMIRKMEE
jgi:isocitrate dehydrogenase